MDRDKIIYWAGFFDGEGHIEISYQNPTYANPYGRYSFEVFITQVAKNPNNFFADLLEIGGGVNKNNKSNPNWDPNNYHWRVSGERARSFLEVILPYLRGKKRAAELAIELSQRLSNFRLSRISRDEIIEETRKRDAILRQFYDLPKRYKSKRRHSYGSNYLEVRLSRLRAKTVER